MFQTERTMGLGPVCGKNRENFGGSEEGSGACGKRKAGEASEVQTTKGRLPWLLPPPARPPSRGCFAVVHGSIPPTILEEGKIGAGPSGCLSRSFSVPRAWEPAREWEVMLGFSMDLEGLSVPIVNTS